MESIAALLIILTSSVSGLSSSELEIVKAIANAYKANRVAAQFGKSEFDFESGYVANLDALKNGDWNVKYVAKGVHVFDGTNLRHEVVYDRDDRLGAVTKMGENEWHNGPLFPARVLTDGFVTLVEHHTLLPDPPVDRRNVSIVAGSSRACESVIFPIDLGVQHLSGGSFAEVVDAAISGSPDVQIVRIDAQAEYEGRRVVEIEFSFKLGGRRCWVDLERGAVPLLTIDTIADMPSRPITTIHDDIRWTGDRCWLPRVKSIMVERLAKTVRITNVELASRPRPTDFELTFEEPVGVIDAVRRTSYSRRKTWSLANIPGGPYRAAVEPAVLPPPPPSFEQEYSNPWLAPLAFLAGSILVIGGVWRIWKSRRA